MKCSIFYVFQQILMNRSNHSALWIHKIIYVYSIIFNNDRALLCMWILCVLALASSVVLARKSGAKTFSSLQLLSVVARGNVTSAGHSSAISQTSRAAVLLCLLHAVVKLLKTLPPPMLSSLIYIEFC